MDTGTESVASALKAVAQSTGMTVLLQDKYPFACLCQGQSRCQPPCAGSYNNCISVKHTVPIIVDFFWTTIYLPSSWFLILCLTAQVVNYKCRVFFAKKQVGDPWGEAPKSALSTIFVDIEHVG
jgi:hypothetical protein